MKTFSTVCYITKLIAVLAVELAKELEEYGLKCSVPKNEYNAGSEAESDGISSEVCIILHSAIQAYKGNIEIQ